MFKAGKLEYTKATSSKWVWLSYVGLTSEQFKGSKLSPYLSYISELEHYTLVFSAKTPTYVLLGLFPLALASSSTIFTSSIHSSYSFSPRSFHSFSLEFPEVTWATSTYISSIFLSYTSRQANYFLSDTPESFQWSSNTSNQAQLPPLEVNGLLLPSLYVKICCVQVKRHFIIQGSWIWTWTPGCQLLSLKCMLINNKIHWVICIINNDLLFCEARS